MVQIIRKTALVNSLFASTMHTEYLCSYSKESNMSIFTQKISFARYGLLKTNEMLRTTRDRKGRTSQAIQSMQRREKSNTNLAEY